MEYRDWAPQYERLRAEFGFSMERERAAADLLESLLPARARSDPLGRLRARLEGRDAIVVGQAPSAGPPPLWRRAAGGRPPAILAADGAAVTCLGAGLVPDLVVTDLDGPVASEVSANRRGSLVVVHANGDNTTALREWVPEFPGELVGSWAGPPRKALVDVGGFTDGDRAAFLAEHLGSSRLLLWGFDFERVEEPEATRARKLAKLRWAGELLGLLAAHARVPVLLWDRDGSIRPYPYERYGASTR